jgi:HlyD family secretion protein
MKRWRRMLYGGVVVVVVAGVGYYFLGQNGAEESQAATGQVQRIVTLAKGDLNLVVSANGVVQPINSVEIKSKASGQIEQLNFEEGDHVERGQLLIALDQATAKNDYEQAKADLATAEANLTQAENNNRRAQELFSLQLISEQERDQSNVDLVRIRAQVIKAQAALSLAEERLRETRITAPISGIILTKNVELGQIISSGVSNVGGGSLLATIADMQQVHVQTNVDEVDIGRVAVGQTAKVVADAYPDQTFTGEVVRISPLGKTQQNVTTFNVIILVRNIGGRLKAGMSASVDIEIFNRKQVLLIPNDALRDPQSEQGRILLAQLREREGTNEGKADTAKVDQQGTEDPQAMRERLMNMSPEERMKEFQRMRERFANMSPEEQERARSQMRSQFGGGQGGGGGQMTFRMGSGGGMDGSQGQRVRRAAQVGSTQEVRRRLVEVKQGSEFVPKMIEVGPSNFDYSEVLGGLNEGDEVRITTISRAKIASEQFNERMRSMQSVGGIGGGRVPTGGGRR